MNLCSFQAWSWPLELSLSASSFQSLLGSASAGLKHDHLWCLVGQTAAMHLIGHMGEIGAYRPSHGAICGSGSHTSTQTGRQRQFMSFPNNEPWLIERLLERGRRSAGDHGDYDRSRAITGSIAS